jgi:hypothetical protein
MLFNCLGFKLTATASALYTGSIILLHFLHAIRDCIWSCLHRCHLVYTHSPRVLRRLRWSLKRCILLRGLSHGTMPAILLGRVHHLWRFVVAKPAFKFVKALVGGLIV